jgi:hypothetical protein
MPLRRDLMSGVAGNATFRHTPLVFRFGVSGYTLRTIATATVNAERSVSTARRRCSLVRLIRPGKRSRKGPAISQA